MNPSPISSEACLAGYVERLQQEGELQSTGRFTLSADKSREKLAQFRLLDKRLYVLNAVAAAVALGAGPLDITANQSTFKLSTRPAQELPLGNLLDHLLSDGCAAGLRELALAYYGAQALMPESICVRWGEEQLDWPGDRHQRGLPHQVELSFEVRERLTWRRALKWWSQATGSVRLDSEEDALKRHCNLLGLPASLNGQPLVRPLLLGNHQGAGLWLPDQTNVPLPFQSLNLPHETRRRAILMARGGRLPPFVVLVVQGVSFRLPPDSVHAHCRAIVYADDLRKDLSQASLRRDDTFIELVSELRELFQRLS